MKAKFAIAVFAAAVILTLAGCSSPDPAAPEAAASQTTDPNVGIPADPADPAPADPAATTPTPTASLGGSGGSDTSIADALQVAGVSDDLVRQLGVVASETGYGLGRGDALPFDTAQNFAYMMVLTCREIASGSLTYASSQAQAVADGAAESDAARMMAFVEAEYCPVVSIQ
jgi:hypothetical protein